MGAWPSACTDVNECLEFTSQPISGKEAAHVAEDMASRGSVRVVASDDVQGTPASDDWGLRNPITGIAGCCARAANGHATAVPPRSLMNSRRFTR
jgi:hypothetical protein